MVGIDGSAAAAVALERAVVEARARRATLLVACVVELPDGVGVDVASHRLAAEEVLAEAVARAADELGGDRVRAHLAVGSPGAELASLCRPRDLLVVGTHGHRPVARMVLGSVSTALVAAAPCPVQVVHGSRLRRLGPVVVGVDGSVVSRAALEHAAEAALTAGARLRVVTALPPVTDATGVVTAPTGAEQDARRALVDECVRTVTRRRPGLGVDVVLVLAHPVDALLRHARDARLVVVGSRGLGGLQAMLMGSVSREVVHRAECPVTVVRDLPLEVVHREAG
ncbi:universal stress protein [Thalassiella azotivora]